MAETKTFKKEIEYTLKGLHQKIDSMKEKVDKLCETTGGFKTIELEAPKKDKK